MRGQERKGRAARPWHRLRREVWLPHPWQCSKPGWMGFGQPGLKVSTPLPWAGNQVVFKVPPNLIVQLGVK